MWKREGENSPQGGAAPPASPAAAAAATGAAVPPASPLPARRESEPAARAGGETGQRALLSPSIVVRGEVAGDEDLLIEGRVEGKISLAQNLVVVGAKGRVAAEIHARSIQVEGEVDGNLVAEEQIVLHRSARVRGDLVAPRVTIDDGARFKGAIDMEPKGRAGAPAPRSVATSPAPPAPSREERPAPPVASAMPGAPPKV